jgi:sulfur-oxidizing protein SoxX
MIKNFVWIACLMAAGAFAQELPAIEQARVDAAVKAAFPRANADWLSRLKGDQTMQTCSANGEALPAASARQVAAREAATIAYPTDGELIGDWKKGEQLAQSGYGLRFTDYPAKRENGGNCYACHQLTKQEVSYGTIGPSLLEYGKIRNFAESAARATYAKIYNAHATFPCSSMPRFGTNGVLSIDQIKHIVAFLMSPASPVNR